jgi:hypothetical protein
VSVLTSCTEGPLYVIWMEVSCAHNREELNNNVNKKKISFHDQIKVGAEYIIVAAIYYNQGLIGVVRYAA